MHPDITPPLVREFLDYNSDNGFLIWRKRPEKYFSNNRTFNAWNARYAGTKAGTKTKSTKDSYSCIAIDITIDGVCSHCRAHRLAWMHYYNEDPGAVIDHINRNALDNRISNLRKSSVSLNCWNKSRNTNNTSGITNVYWEKKYQKWFALVRLDGRNKFLGYYDDKIDAAKRVAVFRKENGQPMHHHWRYLDA